MSEVAGTWRHIPEDDDDDEAEEVFSTRGSHPQQSPASRGGARSQPVQSEQDQFRMFRAFMRQQAEGSDGRRQRLQQQPRGSDDEDDQRRGGASGPPPEWSGPSTIVVLRIG